MYKIIINDGITLIEDDQVAKDIIKNIKKISGFFTNSQVDVLTDENGGYTIDDLTLLDIKKVNKTEQKYIREHYPMVNVECVVEYIKRVIDENGLDERGVKNIDSHLKDFENYKYNALLPKGKTAEKFKKILLPDDFYEKLSLILIKSNNLRLLNYEIDEVYKNGVIEWIKSKKKMSYFKDLILKEGRMLDYILDLENDLINDEDIIDMTFNSDWVVKYGYYYYIGLFAVSMDFDKFKEKFNDSELKKVLINDVERHLLNWNVEKRYLDYDLENNSTRNRFSIFHSGLKSIMEEAYRKSYSEYYDKFNLKNKYQEYSFRDFIKENINKIYEWEDISYIFDNEKIYQENY